MTTGVDQPPSAPVQPAPAKPNPFQRMVGVFLSPVETLRGIADRPDIVVPLIVVVLISFVSVALLVPHIDFAADIQARLAAQGNVPNAQAERGMNFALAIVKASFYVAPLFIPLGWAVYSAIVLLLFRLFGAEGTFPQAYSIKVYSSLPLIIRGILGAIIGMSRTKIPLSGFASLVRSNLSFLSDMKTNPVLFTLLSALDVFMIWSLILLVIGYAYVFKVSRSRSAAVVVILWLGAILLAVGAAALGTLGAKART
jgi:hypothetical protein